MKYRLTFLSGSLTGRVREMDASEVVLGRDPEAAQVVFEDRLVSRKHAVLLEQDGMLVLRDLDSRSGTFLGGEDVEEAELQDGDVFELGPDGPRIRVEFKEGGTLLIPAPAIAVPAAAARPLERPPVPPLSPGSKLRLTFQSGTRRGDTLDAAGAVIRMGRARGSGVWTPEDRVVSAQHAKLVKLEDGYVLLDLESTNGTFLNGQRVERAPLRDGDVIQLGTDGPEIGVRVLAPTADDAGAPATVVIPNFADLLRRGSTGAVHAVREVPLAGTLVVGRGPDVDLRLDSPIVSRVHLRVTAAADGALVEDLGSANGTFVSGQRVESSRLHPGDHVVVGPYQLEVAPPAIRVWDTRSRTRVDARGLTVRVGERLILSDVSLSLPPGSFTAFIGPSGAGKSTLLSALSGARPADEGEVRLNGTDLYSTFDRLKATLGYVPQDDIVHGELTVEESLLYTARLRLPRSVSRAEREVLVSQVLGTLELTERRRTEVRRLSGGQRKRVSIAVELLTEPNLLFLDEPTSGLDPGLEEALMLLLRELSYKGKTVVLVTHTLDNIGLCDAVTLLVDGRVAFHGSADEARAHFGIDHIVNLYRRLKERPAREWQAHFEASEVHTRHVEAPLVVAPPAPVAAPRPGKVSSPPGQLGQLGILTSRYFKTLARDVRNAALLLGQAPLIAGLIGLSLLYGPSEIAYTKPKNTLLFLLALTAVWFGCSNAARELVKERSIYLRERMVNLRVIPYVLSKVLVLAALALLQCLMLYGILDRWFGLPGRPLLLLGSMALAATVGILLGLMLSALVGSADRAMTLLPIVLIPQVLFTVPAVQMDMKGPSGFVARAMPTWWAFDLLRRVALEPGDALEDDQIEEQLKARGPVLMTKRRLEGMLQEGYMMFNYRSAMEATWTASLPETLAERLPTSLGRWRPAAVDALALLAFATVFMTATAFLQRRHAR